MINTFLLCSHELILTGAPLFLVELAEELIKYFNIIFYSPTDGPLRERLSAAGIPVTFDLDINCPVLANTILNYKIIETAKSKGIPSLWVIHESNPQNLNLSGFNVKSLRFPEKTIFCSTPTASLYERYCSPTVIHSIVKPFQPLTIKKPSDKFTIVNIGTIEKRKGQSDLVSAVERLDVQCYLVGQHINQEVRETPQVTIVPPTAECKKYLAFADLFVFCSRNECFPRVIQEAAIQGIPIITTPTFGVREQIHDGVHGLFYMPGDIAGLRNKIVELMNNVNLRKQITRPLNHLDSFQTMVSRYVGLMKDLLR
jgi:glycosyltransferase involved in cell wall biosynthesis